MVKILFADGDPHIQFLCQEEFQEEGYDVTVASNGKEAVFLLDKVCPDVVVTELLLPDMSGMETLRIIKGTCKNTPVIFFSTYGLPQSPGTLGADGLVIKTHDIDHLKHAVRQILQSGKTSRGSRPIFN